MVRPVDRPAQDFRHTIGVSARSSQPVFQQVANPSPAERGCDPPSATLHSAPRHKTPLKRRPLLQDGDEASLEADETAGISLLVTRPTHCCGNRYASQNRRVVYRRNSSRTANRPDTGPKFFEFCRCMKTIGQYRHVGWHPSIGAHSHFFSNGKITFQSFFMSTTVHRFNAAASRATSSLPNAELRSYAYSRSASVW